MQTGQKLVLLVVALLFIAPISGISDAIANDFYALNGLKYSAILNRKGELYILSQAPMENSYIYQTAGSNFIAISKIEYMQDAIYIKADGQSVYCLGRIEKPLGMTTSVIQFDGITPCHNYSGDLAYIPDLNSNSSYISRAAKKLMIATDMVKESVDNRWFLLKSGNLYYWPDASNELPLSISLPEIGVKLSRFDGGAAILLSDFKVYQVLLENTTPKISVIFDKFPASFINGGPQGLAILTADKNIFLLSINKKLADFSSAGKFTLVDYEHSNSALAVKQDGGLYHFFNYLGLDIGFLPIKDSTQNVIRVHSDYERVLNYLESLYPNDLGNGSATATFQGIEYRSYEKAKAYFGVNGVCLYKLNHNEDLSKMQCLMQTADAFALAASAGF